MATNEQMKMEFAYFGEVWTFFKKYYEVEQSDEFWESVIAEAAAINQKYQCPLCKDLILAVLNELERKSKMPQNATKCHIKKSLASKPSNT